MNRTAVIFSPRYCEHNPGRNHPESAKRFTAIMNELKKDTLSQNRDWRFVEPTKASVEDVKLVHDTEYIKHVRSVCRSGGGLLDLEDTVVSPKSFEVALYAVGGTLKAVDLVMERKFQIGIPQPTKPIYCRAQSWQLRVIKIVRRQFFLF